MAKLPPPYIVNQQGTIIVRQNIKTTSGSGFTYNTNAPSGVAGTSGFGSGSNLTVSGGTGITFSDGTDFITAGGWYVDNPYILEGLLDGLDEDAKKELKNIFGLIKYNENSYKYTLSVIRRIYSEFKLGWNTSEYIDSNFSPTEEESVLLLNYFKLDIEKMVFLLEKQSKEMLPLLAKTYPTQDVELDFIRLYSKNYVAQVLNKDDINQNSDDISFIFDRLKVIDAYSVDVFDEENVAEFGHIEFMHRWNGNIIEFDLTICHDDNHIIEYFDSESQKNAEELGIKELNKKILDYVIEKYDRYF